MPKTHGTLRLSVATTHGPIEHGDVAVSWITPDTCEVLSLPSWGISAGVVTGCIARAEDGHLVELVTPSPLTVGAVWLIATDPDALALQVDLDQRLTAIGELVAERADASVRMSPVAIMFAGGRVVVQELLGAAAIVLADFADDDAVSAHLSLTGFTSEEELDPGARILTREEAYPPPPPPPGDEAELVARVSWPVAVVYVAHRELEPHLSGDAVQAECHRLIRVNHHAVVPHLREGRFSQALDIAARFVLYNHGYSPDEVRALVPSDDDFEVISS